MFVNIDDTLPSDQKVTFLKAGQNLLGRSPDSPIQLTEKSISRQHARVNYDQEQMVYWFTHINEHTGSFIKINPVPPHLLRLG